MRSIFYKRTFGVEHYSGYILDDKWSPDFDSELKLAVASFHADNAFHQVFGEGRQLDEKSLTWHFIGLIVNRRFNAISHLVTVRKDGDLKAVMAGTFNTKPPMLKQFINHIKQERVLDKINPNADNEIKTTNYERILSHYKAIKDESLETRLRLYFQQIGQLKYLHHSGPNHFTITMIAVDPDEQGRGHLRAMLARLIKYLENNSQVEYVMVSTYDYAKVEMYEHLGFTTVEETDADDMKSWVLKLPLTM